MMADSQAELDAQQQKQNDRIRQLTEEKKMVEELLVKVQIYVYFDIYIYIYISLSLCGCVCVCVDDGIYCCYLLFFC